jgi:hypothetical protein
MAQQPFSEVVDAQTKNHESMDRPLGPQLRMMTRVLLAAAERMSILLLAGALVVVIGATAFSQIRLNAGTGSSTMRSSAKTSART